MTKSRETSGLGRIAGLVVAVMAFYFSSALAQDESENVVSIGAPQGFSADEIRELVAPIALFPDDLLALILPASTNPLQIVEAERFLTKHKSDPNLQPNADWDPAILALLNYGDVIESMSGDLDWTQQLGNAVLDQQSDVMDMIQQVRAEATASGYLESNDNQVVEQQGSTVIIQSAQPEVIYVPTYDPQVIVEHQYTSYPPPVYSAPYPYYYNPGATFFAGAMTGAVFAYAFDWNDDDIHIDCCDRGDIDIDRGDIKREINIENNGNVNIGSDKIRANKIDSNRFNAEAKAGQGKMKWSPQKAKKTSTTTKQIRNKTATGVAPVKPKITTGQTTKSLKPKSAAKISTRPGDQGKIQVNRGLGTYQTGLTTHNQSKRGHNSLATGVGTTSRQFQTNKAAGALGKSSSKSLGSKSKSRNAFSGAGGNSLYVPTQRNRGSGSLQRSGRPSRSSRR